MNRYRPFRATPNYLARRGESFTWRGQAITLLWARAKVGVFVHTKVGTCTLKYRYLLQKAPYFSTKVLGFWYTKAQDPTMEESSPSTNLRAAAARCWGHRDEWLGPQGAPTQLVFGPLGAAQLLQPHLQHPTSPPSASITPGSTQGPEGVTYPVATSVPVLQAVAFPRMAFPAGQSLSTPPTPR